MPLLPEQYLLDVCDKFMKKPMDDRKEFAKTKGLCYACLKPNHISKKCRARASCRFCSKRHPTALHFDKKEDTIKAGDSTDEDTTALKFVIAHAANSHEASSGDSTTLILPFYVSFGENLTDEKLVYALLDVQSHVCFITQRTSSELNASGVKSTIRLLTLSTKDEIVNTEKISYVYVHGYNSTQRTRLPPIFTRPEIPVNRASIPTHQTAKMLPHLECVEDKMVPLMDVEVRLLIGRQCRQLIAPRDIKPAQLDGPFGQKTSLG